MKRYVLSAVKRAVCFLLVLGIGTGFCMNAFAADMQAPASSGAILITVDTLEEYNAIVQENEAHNRKVEQLWQQALSESGTQAHAVPRSQIGVMSADGYVVASKDYYDSIGLFVSAYVGFSATFTTTTNLFGTTTISEVRSINAYAGNSDSVLTVNDSSYSLIDSNRTIAVHYSCLVGVRISSESGNYDYYTRSYYVEFHVDGSAIVYG